MPRLYMITVPGLEVKADWLPIHDRLLDEFPNVTDVLPTTIPETLLMVYRGRAQMDAWLDGISDAVQARRRGAPASRGGPPAPTRIRRSSLDAGTRSSVLSTDPSADPKTQIGRNPA